MDNKMTIKDELVKITSEMTTCFVNTIETCIKKYGKVYDDDKLLCKKRVTNNDVLSNLHLSIFVELKRLFDVFGNLSVYLEYIYYKTKSDQTASKYMLSKYYKIANIRNSKQIYESMKDMYKMIKLDYSEEMSKIGFDNVFNYNVDRVSNIKISKSTKIFNLIVMFIINIQKFIFVKKKLFLIEFKKFVYIIRGFFKNMIVFDVNSITKNITEDFISESDRYYGYMDNILSVNKIFTNAYLNGFKLQNGEYDVELIKSLREALRKSMILLEEYSFSIYNYSFKLKEITKQ